MHVTTSDTFSIIIKIFKHSFVLFSLRTQMFHHHTQELGEGNLCVYIHPICGMSGATLVANTLMHWIFTAVLWGDVIILTSQLSKLTFRELKCSLCRLTQLANNWARIWILDFLTLDTVFFLWPFSFPCSLILIMTLKSRLFAFNLMILCFLRFS